MSEASAMVWAGVMTAGKKTPLTFIPEAVKVTEMIYKRMLEEEVSPWSKRRVQQ